MARTWTDTEIRQIREERVMGAKIRDLCRKWDMSEGHMSRILAGTARKEAGGIISTGEKLVDRRSDLEKLQSMTDEERTAFYLATKETAGVVMPVVVPKAEVSEGARGYGARTSEDLLRESIHRFREETGVETTPVVPEDYPRPPNWMEDYGGQDERRPNDPNELLDELMKK